MQSFLRLTAGGKLDEALASEGLRASLARAGGAPDFAALKETLITTAQGVLEVYDELIEIPARAAGGRIERQDEARGPP